ncbi:MAG: tetratricopeptide repeat protein [Bacteroidales bacterium]|nr:tetratricopeptide repeat protein [Bacteroidales bacterium]MBN2750730.1 tetratricopeptide repeat protein [Bacteroidales bacterium]
MKRIILFAIFLLTTLAASAQSDVASLIDSGNTKIKQKEYALAIRDFEQALKAQPADTAALNGIILANLLAKNLKEAERYAEQSIALHPLNPTFYYQRGVLNNIKEQYRRSIEDFTKALELNPNQSLLVQIYLNRALANIRETYLDAAMADYNAALEIDPRNSSVYNSRGFTNYRLGNYLDAINDYSKGLDLEPNNAISVYNRGMAYLKLGDKANACVDFHKSCKLENVNGCKMVVSECSSKRIEGR